MSKLYKLAVTVTSEFILKTLDVCARGGVVSTRGVAVQHEVRSWRHAWTIVCGSGVVKEVMVVIGRSTT